MARETDVNVGGPDGPTAGSTPPMTVGRVLVPYDGDDSRRWLWDRLDEVRAAYERRYGNGTGRANWEESTYGRYQDMGKEDGSSSA